MTLAQAPMTLAQAPMTLAQAPMTLAHSGNSGCLSGPHIHIETASVPAGQSTGLSTCNSQNPAGNCCP